MEYKQEELNIEKKYLTEEEVRALIATSMLNQTDPQRVQSGYIQSGNYADGNGNGWKLTSTEAFLPNITLSGGTIKYLKTGFTDATHAGYYIGSEGLYMGDAADATKLKYTIADGTLVLVGSITATAGSVIATSYLSGSVALSNTNIAAMGWTQTCVFSKSDLDTVAWAAGTLITAGGTTYNIGGGNTGNMAARTFIYLDIAVSTTAYQVTTTAATAVGSGKILVATAINGAVDPTWEVFGGIGGLHLSAVDAIVANSITSGLINVSQLSAISADLGTITAGTITGVLIRTAASGERVVMTSNKIYTYDSSDNITAYLNGYSTYGSILYLKNFVSAVCPFRVDNEVNANYCATFNNNSATTGVSVLASMLDVNNTGTALYAAQNGLGYTGYFYSTLVSHASNVVGIFNDSTNSATTNLYSELTSTSSDGYTAKFLHKGHAGYGVWIECDNANHTGNALYVTQAGANSSCAVFASAGGVAIATIQNTVTSIHFKKSISLGGTILWISDGTTPAGALSGTAGDLCLNADSGKSYYCTGTTNWTVM